MTRNYEINDIHSKQNLIDMININKPNIKLNLSLEI